jgi:hypothetical protein
MNAKTKLDITMRFALLTLPLLGALTACSINDKSSREKPTAHVQDSLLDAGQEDGPSMAGVMIVLTKSCPIDFWLTLKGQDEDGKPFKFTIKIPATPDGQPRAPAALVQYLFQHKFQVLIKTKVNQPRTAKMDAVADVFDGKIVKEAKPFVSRTFRGRPGPWWVIHVEPPNIIFPSSPPDSAGKDPRVCFDGPTDYQCDGSPNDPYDGDACVLLACDENLGCDGEVDELEAMDCTDSGSDGGSCGDGGTSPRCDGDPS